MPRSAGWTPRPAPAGTCSSAPWSAPACRSACSGPRSTRWPPEPVRSVTERSPATGSWATRVQVSVADVAEHRTWARRPRPAGEGALDAGVRDGRSRRSPGWPRPRRPGAPGSPSRTCTSTRSAPWTRSPTWSVPSPGLEHLGLDRLSASPVALGGGSARSAHGVVPVPPPAVLELLRGVPVRAARSTVEMCTPTGAALLAARATGWGAAAGAGVTAVGVGAGGRDPDERANVRRGSCWADRRRRAGAEAAERRCVLETNVDDLDPRLWPAVIDRAAGGRGQRRLADPDPDEEGPSGAHALRAGRRRPGGGGAARGLPAHHEHRAARAAGRQARARPRAGDGRRRGPCRRREAGAARR